MIIAPLVYLYGSCKPTKFKADNFASLNLRPADLQLQT